MKITFNGWFDDDIHNTFEQIKRIDSGSKLGKKILSFDADAKTMSIQGSGSEPYHTTLDDCDCPDFSFRQLPCKHMYCLALNLGLAANIPVYKKKESSFDASAEIDRYTDLYMRGEVSCDVYVKICSVLSKV